MLKDPAEFCLIGDLGWHPTAQHSRKRTHKRKRLLEEVAWDKARQPALQGRCSFVLGKHQLASANCMEQEKIL